MLHRVFNRETKASKLSMRVHNEEWKAPALYLMWRFPLVVRSLKRPFWQRLARLACRRHARDQPTSRRASTLRRRLLGVLRLDLERLLSRLGCYQLLKCAGRVLKRLLGVIGNLGSNSLEAFIRLTISADHRIEAFLACPLKLFTGPKLLSHVEAFLAGLMQCTMPLLRRS